MPNIRATATDQESKDQDAIQMLTADHKEVRAMFKEFESLKETDDADEEKAELVQRICTSLTIHATVEEEIFYPAVREGIDNQDFMDEADVEHACAKDLIAQLEAASPGDDHYEAKVTVLGELIEHHVKEEEGEMFPKAKKGIDIVSVGAELAARKAELQAEMGAGEPMPQDTESVGLPAAENPRKKATAKRNSSSTHKS